jgi:hypothetical protein
MPNDAYLGNSVYVHFNGYEIVLEAQVNGRVSRILLDPRGVQALVEFNRRVWADERSAVL